MSPILEIGQVRQIKRHLVETGLAEQRRCVVQKVTDLDWYRLFSCYYFYLQCKSEQAELRLRIPEVDGRVYLEIWEVVMPKKPA